MKAFNIFIVLMCLGLMACRDPSESSSTRRDIINSWIDDSETSDFTSEAQYIPGLPTQARLAAYNANYDTAFVNGMMYCIMSKDATKQFDSLRDLYKQCRTDQSKCVTLQGALQSINSACLSIGTHCKITEAYVPYLVHLCYTLGGY